MSDVPYDPIKTTNPDDKYDDAHGTLPLGCTIAWCPLMGEPLVSEMLLMIGVKFRSILDIILILLLKEF